MGTYKIYRGVATRWDPIRFYKTV